MRGVALLARTIVILPMLGCSHGLPTAAGPGRPNPTALENLDTIAQAHASLRPGQPLVAITGTATADGRLSNESAWGAIRSGQTPVSGSGVVIEMTLNPGVADDCSMGFVIDGTTSAVLRNQVFGPACNPPL
jgi:hypothetical protein